MIRSVLFLLMMVVALGAAFLSPFGALLSYLWFALFRPQEWIWIDVSELRLSLVLGILLIGRSLVKGIWPNFSHRISLGILFFFCTGLLAQVNAVSQDVGWQWIDYFFRLTLVCLFLVSLVNTQRRFLFTIVLICTSIGYYTVKAGLVSLMGGGVQFYDGLGGAYKDNNAYAVVAIMIAPLLLSVADNMPANLRWKRFLVYGYRFAACLTCYTAICTFSRSGFLSLIASAVTYIILQARQWFGKVILFILVCLVVLPIIPLPEGLEQRIQTIHTYEETGETSALSRLHFWRVAWNIATDNPLGIGMRNFELIYDRYDFRDGQFGRGRSVHNSHLQVLTENGFIGFSIWMWLFISSTRGCLRMRRIATHELRGTPDGTFFWTMAGALIVSMVGFIIGGTFISLALNDLTWITFALVAALERICQQTVHERSNEHTNLENVVTQDASRVTPYLRIQHHVSSS